jgi:hypothetical protein
VLHADLLNETKFTITNYILQLFTVTIVYSYNCLQLQLFTVTIVYSYNLQNKFTIVYNYIDIICKAVTIIFFFTGRVWLFE